MLSSRVIEGQLYFHVLDKGDSFPSELALLGIRDCMGCDMGLSDAVRAYLAKNHLGMSA